MSTRSGTVFSNSGDCSAFCFPMSFWPLFVSCFGRRKRLLAATWLLACDVENTSRLALNGGLHFLVVRQRNRFAWQKLKHGKICRVVGRNGRLPVAPAIYLLGQQRAGAGTRTATLSVFPAHNLNSVERSTKMCNIDQSTLGRTHPPPWPGSSKRGYGPFTTLLRFPSRSDAGVDHYCAFYNTPTK